MKVRELRVLLGDSDDDMEVSIISGIGDGMDDLREHVIREVGEQETPSGVVFGIEIIREEQGDEVD